MRIIAFQGRPGAYSDLACREARPGWETLPCASFADAIQAVRDGVASEAMLACENSLAGRVPDIHALLPRAGLQIVGEHFQRVEHCLMAVRGTRIGDVRRIHTHPVAMAQIRELIAELKAEAVPQFDTAGAAEMVAGWGRPEDAAVASSLAAELNGLEVLRANVEDASHNTTRFYIAARSRDWPLVGEGDMMTTLLFRVANRSGALYNALAGYAASRANITRLESYMLEGSFAATQFLMDVEGHPDDEELSRALSAMRLYTDHTAILGVYPASPQRKKACLDARQGGE